MTERRSTAAPGSSAATIAADLSIDRLDVIAPGAFAAAVVPLFEGARGFLGRLAMARPFGSVDGLFASAREIARTMPLDEQLGLIDAHPRLGASPAAISPLSFVEQGYDRDAGEGASPKTAGDPGDPGDPSDPVEADRARIATELHRLNALYEAHFGFRYCVFVAGRSRAELLPGLAAALDRDRDAEIARALEAVVDIARDRYATLTDPVAETGA
ncbi:MAG: 2-oxo-4-hydroxy-4-carboxy-5-ureidoimidazoline decarboxylase [Chloroflexota bacterium]